MVESGAGYMVIAGTGVLPRIIKEDLPQAKILCIDIATPEIEPDITIGFGEVGRLLNFARENGVKKIIFAGGMSKPDFSKIRPDAEGAKLLAKIVAGRLFKFGKNDGGDDAILSKIINFLESKGFEVVAVNDVVKDLVAPKGIIAGNAPSSQMLEDIELGMTAAHNLGKLDIGQAVVVEDGVVLATENVEGTANLIARAGELKRSYGGVLVKACKPQQDVRVDLPSIGEQTILQLVAAGIAGVAVESGKSLLLEKQAIISRAEKSGIVVFGA